MKETLNLIIVLGIFAFSSFQPILAEGMEEIKSIISKRYHFDEHSSYEVLLEGLNQAYLDCLANPNDRYARYATMIVDHYASPQERVRFAMDFGLNQKELATKKRAIQKIYNYINDNQEIQPSLQEQLCESVWSSLSQIDDRGLKSKEMLRTCTKILLSLGDERGLSLIMADKRYVERIKLSDKWSEISDSSIFRILAEKYKKSKNEAEKNKAMFYELLQKRKSMGKQLDPNNKLPNIESFYE